MDFNSRIHKIWFPEKFYLGDEVKPKAYGEVKDSSDEEMNSKIQAKKEKPDTKVEEKTIADPKAAKKKLGDEPFEEESEQIITSESEDSSEIRDKKRKKRAEDLKNLPPQKSLLVDQPKLKHLAMTNSARLFKKELSELGYDDWEIDEAFELKLDAMQVVNRTLFVSLSSEPVFIYSGTSEAQLSSFYR